MVGRRVRLEHIKWLEPLMARHRTYRRAEARLRTVTLTLANYAQRVAATLQHRIDSIRKKTRRMSIPPDAPSFSPMIFRRV